MTRTWTAVLAIGVFTSACSPGPKTRRSRAWLILLLSGSVLAVLSAAVPVGPAGLDALDAAARLLARSSLQPAIDLANVAGGLPFWLAAVAALAFVGVARHWPRLEGLAVAGLAEIASVAIKVAVGRPRPPGANTADLLPSTRARG